MAEDFADVEDCHLWQPFNVLGDWKQMVPIVNVASVAQLSPFRYPGGKTWLVPFVNRRLRRLGGVELFIDPFLGGGSVPLAAISEGLAKRAVLCEIDEDVAAVWKCVLGRDSRRLASRILEFQMTRENVIDEIAKAPNNTLDRAFRTILKNRTFRGGILAEGASLMKSGEAGRGVASRWYAATLAKRITKIAEFAPRISFDQGDGFELLERYVCNQSAFIFLDPPYSVGKGAGARLYRHAQLDHRKLFELSGSGSAEILMTYDSSSDVLNLAKDYCFAIERVPMKNTHHIEKFELVISRHAQAEALAAMA